MASLRRILSEALDQEVARMVDIANGYSSGWIADEFFQTVKGGPHDKRLGAKGLLNHYLSVILVNKPAIFSTHYRNNNQRA